MRVILNVYGPKFIRLCDTLGPFVVSNVILRLCVSCFVLKVFTVEVAIKLRSRKRHKKYRVGQKTDCF